MLIKSWMTVPLAPIVFDGYALSVKVHANDAIGTAPNCYRGIDSFAHFSLPHFQAPAESTPIGSTSAQNVSERPLPQQGQLAGVPLHSFELECLIQHVWDMLASMHKVTTNAAQDADKELGFGAPDIL